MLNTDRDALICDLAETYHIYDYGSLPLKTVAALSCGLRNDSRIKMKMDGMEVTTTEMLLAAIVDSTRMLVWIQSEDGVMGINKPTLIIDKMMNRKTESEVVVFQSGEEFEEAWKRMTKEK